MTAVSSSNPSIGLIRAIPVPSARAMDGAVAASADASSAWTASDAQKLQQQSTNASADAASTPAGKAPDSKELASQVKELQAKMDRLNPALAFVVDQESGRALIQLTDRTTKEVLQQFPSEAALQISKALDRFQKGQLVSRIA